MKRYIIPIESLGVLQIQTTDAIELLSQPILVENDNLHYNQIPFASVMLSDEQSNILRNAGYEIHEEVISQAVALGADYEKVRTKYYEKVKHKPFKGSGVKIGVLDSGVALAVIPTEHAINVADNHATVEDGFGHGTRTASMIKHPTIGIAPDCEFYVIRCISDAGFMTESSALAAFDYVLQNNLDFINLSWTFDTSAVRSAIQAVMANGTVVIASSGNANVTDTATLFPAALPGVVAVNSVQEDGSIAHRNILTPTGGHGVDVACAGWGTELVYVDGGIGASFGTSYASPFLTALLGVYKEMLSEQDNNKVLEYVYAKAIKPTIELLPYLGRGTLTF